jgi:hypothetical protein
MKEVTKSIVKLSVGMLFIFLILGGYIFVDIINGNLGIAEVRKNMETYLYDTEGYNKEDIKQIKYKYSFSSKPFGYDPYIIDVIFIDEPTVIYGYTYKRNQIIPTSVSSTNGIIPDKLKH